MERQHYYCDVCRRLLDESEYYKTNNIKKYPDGRMTTCKKCVALHLKNWDPKTFLPILEEIDVPYIKQEWDTILKEAYSNLRNVSPLIVLGKYLTKMRLKGFKNYRWADTELLEKERQEREAQFRGNK